MPKWAGFGFGPGRYPTAAAAIAALEAGFGPSANTWTYRDTDDQPVGVVLRWNLPPDDPGGKPKKRILPVSRVEGGWANVGMPGPRPLFDLPGLLKLAPGARVLVVEGESCADAARAIGLFATTSAHGSESADKTDWTPLKGKDVIILPDNDKAGKAYADQVAGLAITAEARSVKVVPLPGLGEHQDLVDFLLMHGGDAEAARSQIESLAAAAEYVPQEAGPVSKLSEPDWQLPQPLQVRGGAFPINDAFPESLEPVRDYCQAIGEAFQVPVDMGAMLVPSVIGMTMSQIAVVRLGQEWVQPPNHYNAVLMESGNRKTGPYKVLLEPVYEYEQEQCERLAPEIAAEKAKLDMLRRKADRLKDLASGKAAPRKGEVSGRNAEGAAVELEKELALAKPLHEPQYTTTDITSESLAMLLDANGERLGIFSTRARSSTCSWAGTTACPTSSCTTRPTTAARTAPTASTAAPSSSATRSSPSGS